MTNDRDLISRLASHVRARQVNAPLACPVCEVYEADPRAPGGAVIYKASVPHCEPTWASWPAELSAKLRMFTKDSVGTTLVGKLELPGGTSLDRAVTAATSNGAFFVESEGTVEQPAQADVYRSAYELVAQELFKRQKDALATQMTRANKARAELRTLVPFRDIEDDETAEQLRARITTYLARYGVEGVKSLSELVLGPRSSTELGGFLIDALAKDHDAEIRGAVRELLSAALEGRDSSLRYAAATALGELGDEASLAALRRRSRREKNIGVLRMIEAELR